CSEANSDAVSVEQGMQEHYTGQICCSNPRQGRYKLLNTPVKPSRPFLGLPNPPHCVTPTSYSTRLNLSRPDTVRSTLMLGIFSSGAMAL
ncbi:hypothetical protein KUCAC02_005746, partial [Chaenocephalus aceratus]